MRLIFSLFCSLFLFFSHDCQSQQTDPIHEISSLLDQSDFDKAVILADQYLKADSSNTSLMILKGRALSANYHYEKAILTLEQAFKIDSNSVNVLAELINTCQMAGDPKKSIWYGYKALGINSGNRRLRIQLSLNLFGEEEFRKSITVLLPVLSYDTSDVFVLKILANCYNEMQINDSAAFLYQKMLSIDPKNTFAIKKLSNILIRQKDYQGGLNLVNDYLILDSNNASILKLKGFFLYQLKNYTIAKSVFLRCLQLKDTSQFIYKYQGLCLYAEEKFLDAEISFKNAYHADTNDAEVLFYWGVSDARSFFPTEGIAIMQKAIDKLLPSRSFLSTIYIEISQAYNLTLKQDTGLLMLFKALDINPANKASLFRIAYQYDFYMNDTEKAIEYYELFLNSGFARKTEFQNGTINVSYEDYARKRIEELRDK
jgi:tetratricopeptide (TPR) repeat protein